MKIPFFSKAAQPAPELKRSRGWGLHMVGLQPATWRTSEPEYSKAAREAYQMNVVAYSAIQRIANAIASIEWEVHLRSGEIIYDHPLIDLLKRPNPAMSGPEWWRARVSYLLLSGNNYDERVTDGRRVTELWPLRPDRIRIIQSATGLPAGYIYKVANNERRFSADPVTGESDVRHTKLFHPTDDWYGMSPIAAAAYSIDQHNESMTWVQALLQNAARPSGALISDSEAGLSDEEYHRLKEEIEVKYAGAANAGRPMLLEGGLDWKEMGLSPVDMEILKTKESSARDVSLAFGVPPLLLNIPGDNTYANYREARLGFYEDTLLPFLKFQVADLNDWLGPFFDGAQLQPNRDKIEAIAEKRQRLWEMADNSDDLTLNESRALKGFDPLPEPLGSMLMSEVRGLARGRAAGEGSDDTDELSETLKQVAYGTS